MSQQTLSVVSILNSLYQPGFVLTSNYSSVFITLYGTRLYRSVRWIDMQLVTWCDVRQVPVDAMTDAVDVASVSESCRISSVPLHLLRNACKPHAKRTALNPFSPAFFWLYSKMSLSNRSGPYWSNPPSVSFWHSGTLALSARMSKTNKWWVRPVWPWTLWGVTIWHHWALKG